MAETEASNCSATSAGNRFRTSTGTAAATACAGSDLISWSSMPRRSFASATPLASDVPSNFGELLAQPLNAANAGWRSLPQFSPNFNPYRLASSNAAFCAATEYISPDEITPIRNRHRENLNSCCLLHSGTNIQSLEP